MNKQEIEEDIEILKAIYHSQKEIRTGEYDHVADALDDAISALTQQLSAELTASEFLRKAKAICKRQQFCNEECPIYGECVPENIENEADLVRKVMDYRLEDKNAERN